MRLLFPAVMAMPAMFLTMLEPAPAAERFDYKVRNQFFAGFGGDSESLAAAMKACEETLAANPKYAEAHVWHGAGLYYQGGQAFQKGDGQKGQELTQRGLREMDEAVALEPDNLGVRIPRGAALLQSTLYMPDMPMKRGLIERGISDYQHAYDIQKSTFDQMGTHPKGELLFGLADGYRRAGQEEKARELFQLISEKLKGSNYQKRADIYLGTKTLTPQQVQCVGCHVEK